MSNTTRRGFTFAALASAALLAACGNGVDSNGAQKIDARVDKTLNYLYSNYPGSSEIADQAAGMLIMPVVTEAGFGVGAGYGRGALQIDGITVDYYSATSGSVGFQIGASQSAHVLYFMTETALNEFRRSSGWAAGADVKYAVVDNGQNLAADTTTINSPVYAVIFGQAGLHVGATLEGVKYTRIIP